MQALNHPECSPAPSIHVDCPVRLQVELGATIRRMRLARRWSRERLATLAKTQRPLVARAERGTHALTLTSLIRYACALECSVSDLLREAEGQTRARSSEVQAP